MFKSKLDDHIIAIEAARAKVAKAQQEYSRGGSVAALNRANKELAEAHHQARVGYGLRGPVASDKRR